MHALNTCLCDDVCACIIWGIGGGLCENYASHMCARVRVCARVCVSVYAWQVRARVPVRASGYLSRS